MRNRSLYQGQQIAVWNSDVKKQSTKKEHIQQNQWAHVVNWPHRDTISKSTN